MAWLAGTPVGPGLAMASGLDLRALRALSVLSAAGALQPLAGVASNITRLPLKRIRPFITARCCAAAAFCYSRPLGLSVRLE